MAHHGISVEVRFDDGERGMVRVKRNSGHVVGDRVTVCRDILTRLPRRTELRRRDARGAVHLVAANLDVLGIVVAPPYLAGFADRAIVAARAAGLAPFLVANKCDLEESAELVAALNGTYGGSLPLFELSAAKRTGLGPLQEYLGQGHRGAFVGSTGVGKSSLLNALCPEIDLKVGMNSDYRALGRHTTSVSTLHTLPGGGELVDTPGFRDFGLVELTAQDLAAYFPGFEDLGEVACRFRDCRHRSEPGCSVVEQAQQGRIPEERYQTYLEILDEVEADELLQKSKGWRN